MKSPKGYHFIEPTYEAGYRQHPHYHVWQVDYGDRLDQCFLAETSAKKAMWEVFQREYDPQDLREYTHHVKEGTIEMVYDDGTMLALQVTSCPTPDDCPMLESDEEVSDGPT